MCLTSNLKQTYKRNREKHTLNRFNHPIAWYSANQRAPFQSRDTKLAVRSEFLSTLTKVEMVTKLQ